MTKKFLILMSVAILSLGLFSTTSNAVPIPWNGHLYDVVNAAGITWTDADAALDGTGWYLVTITSQAEQDFVAGLLNSLPNQYWAGGYQIEPNPPDNPLSGWNWIPESADPWGFTAWATAYVIEPNNWGGTDEKYLALDPRFSRNWTWSDATGTEFVGGYVRERVQTVPEPGILILLGIAMSAIGIASRYVGKI